jgi:hypothetical protein
MNTIIAIIEKHLIITALVFGAGIALFFLVGIQFLLHTNEEINDMKWKAENSHD